jgi:miniconductance mechanosensitive channel
MYDSLVNVHPLLPAVAGLLALTLAAFVADLLVKQILLRIVTMVIKHSEYTWDDALLARNVYGRAAHVVPALVVTWGIAWVPDVSEAFETVVRNVAHAYLILVFMLTVSALLSAANDIYEERPVSRVRPLKGFFQLLQILVFVVGVLLVIAALFDKSPTLLLSGVGAMTAVVLLVFKDTILGLVASVQLTTQDMVRVGDWVEMPQYGADGDVIEVGLHIVRVQNFDRTITTIPTYKLISESFKNWRGMSESGGRRIKRPVYIDQSSVRFLETEEIDSLRRFALLATYLDRKEAELDEYHSRLGDAAAEAVNQRRLTNVGTFRAYVFAYLREHPAINEDATLLVRQLAPGSQGLPIEIYCFTHTTQWAQYEDVQSDIFDHILAIVPEFGLKVFQQPSGADIGVALRELSLPQHSESSA